MSIRTKAWAALIAFAVGGLVLMGLSRIADAFGVPHAVLVMIGFGYTGVAGLAVIAYMISLAGLSERDKK